MIKLFIMPVLTFALVATANIGFTQSGLESAVTGRSGALQSFRNFVETKFEGMETVVNNITVSLDNLGDNVRNCGDQRMFLDSGNNCVALWEYNSGSPDEARFDGNIEVTGTAQLDGNVGIGTAPTTYALEVNGQVRAGGYFHSSDERLKENLVALNGLEIVNALRGLEFDWKDGSGHTVGLVAQDVEAVLPAIVTTDAVTGTKAVDYAKLVAPLVEAVKVLDARVAELEQQ